MLLPVSHLAGLSGRSSVSRRTKHDRESKVKLTTDRTVVVPVNGRSTGVIAQSDINLTLRFFTQPQDEDTCSYYNTSSALTFTSRSIPVTCHCFNLADLFGGTATSRFINQTRNAGYTVDGRDLGIIWQLENADLWDPSANYSSVLYRQHISNPGDSDAPIHTLPKTRTLISSSP